MGALDEANWEKWYGKPDLKKTPEESAEAAASKSNDSFDVTLKVALTRASKIFEFWFQYLYQDPDTLVVSEGPRSPIVTHGFDIPNLTKGVQGLTLTAGFKSYGVKFTIDPTSVQEDVVIFESLTADFANQYIVYVGNSTNVSINTSDFSPRWVKVRSRDKWLTQNNTDVIAVGPDAAGSVTPKNADPDTSTPPSAPGAVTPYPFIDANDKSGFSAGSTFTWTANFDANTAGYVIRWTTQNPAVEQNPIWEYGQVDGKATTSFTTTGLLPNTLYYYQVTAKSPYNAISWASPFSGTFGPITDSSAPADVWAQLKSVLSIGGKTADLFKIGTGIAQSINTSTTITPTQTAGTYSGIILNKSTTNFGHNFWLNTGQFRVGSATSFMYWNGSDLFTTGKINATGGSFTGDVQLNGGSLFAGAAALSGARVRLNSAGLFAYDTNNAQTVAITQADGKLDARQGYIGGWTINGTAQTTGTISSSNTKLESNGTITLGDTTGTIPSVVKLSATDDYRIWVGSQSSSAAAFKVSSAGKMYATGAVIDGNATISGTVTIGGTAASTVVSNAANALSSTGTFQGTVGANATVGGVNLSTRLQSAYDKAVAAGDDVTLLKTRTTNAENALALKVAATEVADAINTNTTKIDGAKIVTGSIELSTLKVVGNTTNGLFIDNTGIKAYSGSANTFSLSTNGALSLTGQIFSTSGQIGGFDLSNADLTASTSKSPRIIFGNKILMGWLSGTDYGMRVGNPYGDAGQSFRVYTLDNVNRITVDTSDRTYAAEIRNIVRAVGFRHMGSGFVADSSRRFKENINEMPKEYYERILDVPINFYTYKNNIEDIPNEMWGTHNFGPIVEDMEDAGLGFFVERNLEGLPTSFRNEQKYAFLLIPIVRDMKLKIEQMEAKILELESR
jgi:hypothetical protein